MPAPYTPGLDAETEAALVTELKTYFNDMQVKALLKSMATVAAVLQEQIDAIPAT